MNTDIIHWISKKLSHDRWTAIGAAILASTIGLASCSQFDGKTISKSTGNEVNSDQLQAEYIKESKTLQQRWDAADALEAEAVAAKLKIARESEALDAGFQANAQEIEAEVAARSDLIGQFGTIVIDTVSTSGASWAGPLLALGLSGLTGGVLLDNRRKDGVIKKQTETTG